MKLWKDKTKTEKINDIIDALKFYRDCGDVSNIVLDTINDKLVVQLDFSVQEKVLHENI